MDRKRTALISLLVLVAGGAITWLIFATEPEAERSGAVRQSAMLVDVVEAERGTYQPTIRAMGTVEPARDITLAPRVGGQVVRLSDAFTPGGYVRKGEVLLQIDPADYEIALAQRRGDLAQARTDLEIELGRQDVARQDYQLLRDTIPTDDRSLVLRVPQLEAARSRVEAAEAMVEQAELDLERTTIRAPFDAHVLTRTANVGSQVAPGDPLGRLVGVDTYWVVATVPQSRLRWLTFPSDGEAPSPVRIRNRTAWAEGEQRTGTLHRLVGALEGGTRLARVIVDIPDPTAVGAEADGPPLMIGSFVEALIQARPLEDVVRLDRDYVRDDDTVWVMDDGVLRIRSVDIVLRDADFAYIASGLEPGARVVTTDLSTVVDGAALRTDDTAAAPPGAAPDSAEAPADSITDRPTAPADSASGDPARSASL